MAKYYLQSENTDKVIKTFDNFDREAIREAICDHLTANPTDCVDYYKESLKNDLKLFVGDEFLACYTINPNNKKPSKIIDNNTIPFKRRYKTIKK